MWHVLNRFIAKTTRRNEYMAAQKTAQEAQVGDVLGVFFLKVWWAKMDSKVS